MGRVDNEVEKDKNDEDNEDWLDWMVDMAVEMEEREVNTEDNWVEREAKEEFDTE